MIDITKELRAHGFDNLSGDMQRGLVDAMLGAVDVYVRYAYEPGYGDIGWRAQDLETHLIHASDHITDAEFEVSDDKVGPDATDNDGLPHIDQATARIGLYYARKRLIYKGEAK